MVTDWTSFRAAVNPFFRQFGLYTAYPLSSKEYIGEGVFTAGLDAVRELLRSNNYVPNHLSAAKKHPDTGQLHDLSYRKVPERHPENVQGTAIARDFDPNECQYHVHVFERDTWEFFSHYETRPDFFRPAFSPERLRTHYRPGPKYYFEGVTDLVLSR